MNKKRIITRQEKQTNIHITGTQSNPALQSTTSFATPSSSRRWWIARFRFDSRVHLLLLLAASSPMLFTTLTRTVCYVHFLLLLLLLVVLVLLSDLYDDDDDEPVAITFVSVPKTMARASGPQRPPYRWAHVIYRGAHYLLFALFRRIIQKHRLLNFAPRRSAITFQLVISKSWARFTCTGSNLNSITC